MIFFIVDATIETGLGHFFRCLSIATKLKEVSREKIEFIGKIDSTFALSKIAEKFCEISLPF